ncbi:MAG: hmuV [Cereibacter sp.]|jgi:iron complex transport system ATP-binding protein|nr:hmuV [Cereibacter sp.]
MIETRDLCVSLGRRPVLHDIRLLARAGELTAIVGPNGSGKTTLLRALAGDLPYAGNATLDGQEIAEIPVAELALRRGVLQQATSLSFPFTVLEVVRLGLLRGEEASLAHHALRRVDLEGYAGRLYQELSGGEQQRVHLARVLAQVGAPAGPGGQRWLFLDEPVSSLDIGHQLQVMQLAQGFAASGGGVLAVMHDLNLTAMFAQRVVLMSHGWIAGAGSPAQVFDDGLLSQVYGLPLRVNTAPRDLPYVLPQTALSFTDG